MDICNWFFLGLIFLGVVDVGKSLFLGDVDIGKITFSAAEGGRKIFDPFSEIFF